MNESLSIDEPLQLMPLERYSEFEVNFAPISSLIFDILRLSHPLLVPVRNLRAISATD